MDSDTRVLTGVARRAEIDRGARLTSVLVGLTSLALIAGLVATPTLGIALKVVADPLLHATSNINVWLICAAALAAAVVLFWQSVRDPVKVPMASDGREGSRRFADCTFFGGIALCCGMTTWLQLHTLAVLDLPWHARLRLFDGDDNTVSSLLHNHMGKAALTLLTQPIASRLARYDAGHALHDWVDAPTAVLITLAFATAFVGAVAMLPGIVRQARTATPRVGFAWLGLHSYCALVCLKGSLDGGPLHYAFAPCLLTLVFLRVCGTPDRMARRQAYLGASLIVSGAPLGVLWSLASSLGAETFLVAWSAPVAAIVVLTVLLKATPRTRWRRALACGGACAWMLIVWGHEADLGTGALLASADAVAVTRIGDDGTARHLPPPHRGTSLADIYRVSGDDPLKPHRTFVVSLASAGAPAGARVYLLQTLVPAIATLASFDAPGYRIARVHLRRDRWLLRVEPERELPPFNDNDDFLASRNDQVHTYTLAGALRRAGLARFLLVPLIDTKATST